MVKAKQRMKMVRLMAWAGVIACLTTPAAWSASKVYRIGNSLTWDSQPKAIPALAEQRKLDHMQAYHINCGKSLERIASHPDEVCVDVVKPFGTFGNALPNYDWDAVTFQPHPGKGSTLKTDTDRILEFIKIAQSKGKNKNTVFYIYAAWPGQSPKQDFKTLWTKEIKDADDTRTTHARQYFEHLYKRVKGKTEADVRMIPVGEVLFELDGRIREGKLPEFKKTTDLYRDRVHLNNTGRFVAGVTTFATLFGQDPKGITCPAKAYGGGKGMTPEVYQQIHEAVWKTLTQKKELTGVKKSDN